MVFTVPSPMQFALAEFMREAFRGSILSKLGALLAMGALKRLQR